MKKTQSTEKKEELQYKPYIWLIFGWIIALSPVLVTDGKLWRVSCLFGLFLLGLTIDRIKSNRAYNKKNNLTPGSDFLDYIKEYMWWGLVPILTFTIVEYRDDTIQPRLTGNRQTIVFIVVGIILLGLAVFLLIKLIKWIIKLIKMPGNIEKIREHLENDKLTDEEIDTVVEYLGKHKKK